MGYAARRGFPVQIGQSFGGTLQGDYFYQNRIPKLYIAGSGSPAISPAFSSFWTHTGSAVRVPGKFGKNLGTSYASVAISNPTGSHKQLYVQAVIPLLGKAIQARRFPIVPFYQDPLSFQLYAVTQLPGVASTAVAGDFLAFTARIVDPSGADRGSADHTVTIGYTNGSRTITSSAAFVASDLYRQVYIPGLGFKIGTIVKITSSSSATLDIPFIYAATGSYSSDIIDKRFQSFLESTWAVTGGGYRDSNFTFTVGAVSVYSQVITEKDYLVVELGLGRTSAVSSISHEISTGDPSLTLLTGGGGRTPGYPTGSSGGESFLTCFPAVMYQAR